MIEIAQKIISRCIEQGVKISIAESCTGGMVCAAITAIAGSSQVFDRGFIPYSYESKHEILDVEPQAIQQYGAVSAEVAEQMVKGALKHSLADLALSITGIAGPGGETEHKPVGLVYFSTCYKGEVQSHEEYFQGSREEIRTAATLYGLALLLSLVQ